MNLGNHHPRAIWSATNTRCTRLFTTRKEAREYASAQDRKTVIAKAPVGTFSDYETVVPN